ncbi:hypothetical protein CAter282_4534 [Collimonas arenae]|uniref:Transmembrane protein n=1 Tax=Collimonas arenae TaxID=279058 RepID=A0A127PWY3_9BURK|nr:hypothetical protein [Collimonas arenae]AMP02297.1 hypothetical protein CAter10_4934 [Collimonas arenae]AMP12192.1 hypothetical protein CAter282_4534 [Collimonas arenae]
MHRHPQQDGHLSTAERKQKLLQEGAEFRAAMVSSRDVVRTSLHSRSLLANLFGRITGAASSVFGKPGNIKTANLPALLPLLLSSASWIARRGTRKPLLVGGAALAAIGAAVYLSSRSSKATKDSE